MDYLLKNPLTYDDVEFFYNSSFDWYLHNPDVTENDSGWCDATTGARMLMFNDRAVFKDVSKEELSILTLKYEDRLLPLHDGIKKIYMIKEN